MESVKEALKQAGIALEELNKGLEKPDVDMFEAVTAVRAFRDLTLQIEVEMSREYERVMGEWPPDPYDPDLRVVGS